VDRGRLIHAGEGQSGGWIESVAAEDGADREMPRTVPKAQPFSLDVLVAPPGCSWRGRPSAAGRLVERWSPCYTIWASLGAATGGGDAQQGPRPDEEAQARGLGGGHRPVRRDRQWAREGPGEEPFNRAYIFGFGGGSPFAGT
jgi:hypothetical protein